ncbi:MAG: hypothetical protein J6M40_04480 [Prevotella sp.]|nr:hypothetical protein [Prevotella sp.]
MDKILRIRTLADRFLAAETSLQEERELTELCRNGDLPADLLPVREMLLALESMALTDEERAAAAEEQPSGGQQTHVKVMTPVARGRRWLAAAAAVVVLLAAGAFALWHRQQDECVAYIYGKRCTDRTVVMREMRQNMTDMAESDADVEAQLNEMFSTN